MHSVKRRGLSLAGALALVLALSGAAAAETLHVQMILFWDAYQYVLNELVPKFEEQYGVEVHFERVTWGNREEKLILNTIAGTPPDVFMNGAQHLIELLDAGLLAPLDPYLADWDGLFDYNPVTLENSAYDGVQYGLPLYTDPRIFWYRADFFQEVGLDPDRPPQDWDQLLEAARKLTVTDGAVVTRMGYDLTRWTDGASSAAQDFVVFLWQNGGEFIDPVTFMPRFHEREGVETMTFLRDLMTTVRPPGHTVDPGQGSGSPIVRGTAAMNLNIGGVVAEAYRADERVAAELRAIVPPPGHKEPASVTFTNWLAIHADSDKKDLAWEFIKFISEPQHLLEINLHLGYISPLRSTIIDFVREQPESRYIYETLNYARPYPVFPNTSVVAKAFDPHYFKILAGEIAPDIGLAEAARLWEVEMRQ